MADTKAETAKESVVKKELFPDTIFELIFKKGNCTQHLHFSAPNKEKAVELGKQFCEKRQCRFIFVNPWLHDLQQMIDFEPDEGFRR